MASRRETSFPSYTHLTDAICCGLKVIASYPRCWRPWVIECSKTDTWVAIANNSEIINHNVDIIITHKRCTVVSGSHGISWRINACTNSGYQAPPPPQTQMSLDMCLNPEPWKLMIPNIFCAENTHIAGIQVFNAISMSWHPLQLSQQSHTTADTSRVR